MSKWQKIETARKDTDESYLLWSERQGMCIGSWSPANQCWEEDISGYDVSPTHWQPLPDEPEEEK